MKKGMQEFTIMSFVGIVAIVAIVALTMALGPSARLDYARKAVSNNDNVMNVDRVGLATNTLGGLPAVNSYSKMFADIDWTSWLNRDGPGGSGDWELLKDHLGDGKVMCSQPVAANCITTSGVDWQYTDDNQVYCRADFGLACQNQYQNGTPDNYCEDYKIRFGCLNESKYLRNNIDRFYYADREWYHFIDRNSGWTNVGFGLIVARNYVTKEIIGNHKAVIETPKFEVSLELVGYDVEEDIIVLEVITPLGRKIFSYKNKTGITGSHACQTMDECERNGFEVFGGIAFNIHGASIYDSSVTGRYVSAYGETCDLSLSIPTVVINFPSDSPLWLLSSSRDVTFTNVRDLAGNGILHYSGWGTNYLYAAGYCQIVHGCEGYKDVTLANDPVKACRCDNYWGCPEPKNSCVTDISKYSYWSRIGTVTCTGCPTTTGSEDDLLRLAPAEFPDYESYMNNITPMMANNSLATISQLYIEEDKEFPMSPYNAHVHQYVVNNQTITVEWMLLEFEGTTLTYDVLVTTPLGSEIIRKQVNTASIPTEFNGSCRAFNGVNSSFYNKSGYDFLGLGVAVDLCGVRLTPGHEGYYDTYYSLYYAIGIPTDSPLTKKDCSFTNVRDLKGNGILHYSGWGTNYIYAAGYCKIVHGCEGYTGVILANDPVKACRCDNYWGCPEPKNSCVTDISKYSYWSRIGTVTCTGCPASTC